MLTANQITINTPDLDKTITLNVSESPNRIEVMVNESTSVGESFSDAEGESF